jgi:hypothetical protein
MEREGRKTGFAMRDSLRGNLESKNEITKRENMIRRSEGRHGPKKRGEARPAENRLRRRKAEGWREGGRGGGEGI